MQTKQFAKKLFLSLTLAFGVAGTSQAASVDGVLRSLGLRTDETMSFTHQGKQYQYRVAMHDGHQALHVKDDKGNEAILVRVSGEWVEYRTFRQKFGRTAKKVVKGGVVLGGIATVAGIVVLVVQAIDHQREFHDGFAKSLGAVIDETVDLLF